MVNAQNCWGFVPMAYIGASAPTSSSQFTDFIALPSSGWQTFVHRQTVSSPTVYVALGWHGPAQTLGYPKEVDVDCVTVLLP